MVIRDYTGFLKFFIIVGQMSAGTKVNSSSLSSKE